MNKNTEETDPYQELIAEAIQTIGAANIAVTNRNAQQLYACAYHLQSVARRLMLEQSDDEAGIVDPGKMRVFVSDDGKTVRAVIA